MRMRLPVSGLMRLTVLTLCRAARCKAPLGRTRGRGGGDRARWAALPSGGSQGPPRPAGIAQGLGVGLVALGSVGKCGDLIRDRVLEIR
jgi:hypothetical protein